MIILDFLLVDRNQFSVPAGWNMPGYKVGTFIDNLFGNRKVPARLCFAVFIEYGEWRNPCNQSFKLRSGTATRQKLPCFSPRRIFL